ncbi:MAG TPA: dihydrodipicolinate reductase C-terminal domain-containing protein [Thermoanaerobaculia bacterium]|nr:dihydrodipicolinate reductase C-terminal domain-containing protein [Thermoanaerobaculia bacterium]
MIRVCIAGITGWIGKPLAEAIRTSDDLELVAGASRTLGTSVEDALTIPSDVFVDYTSATAVKANVLAAIAARRHVVVGSSGLSDSDYAGIDAAARANDVGVIAVGNFAISAALLQRFAAEAAKHMPSWEIIDSAHDAKVDAPSGTARELAWRLSQVGAPQVSVPLDQTFGPREARGATVSGSQIHSIRLPGHTIALEILFGREDERLSIRYEGGVGAQPYISGTLLAIRRVQEFRGVVRGMDALI